MDNVEMNNIEMEGQMEGGRRHRGSKKRHSKRRGNASLRAWVTFVKKVQREEKVSYKEAMMRAKKRKDKGEKWRGGGDEDTSELSETMDNYEDESENDDMYGGKRRRRTSRRGSRKNRGRRSRKHR